MITVVCYCVGHGTASCVVCRNVGGNIRDGITGLSGYVLCLVRCLWSVCLHIDGLLVTFEFIFFSRTVMSKPREFAHLIKNKFGSADNINTLASKKALFFSVQHLYYSIFFCIVRGFLILIQTSSRTHWLEIRGLENTGSIHNKLESVSIMSYFWCIHFILFN